MSPPQEFRPVPVAVEGKARKDAHEVLVPQVRRRQRVGQQGRGTLGRVPPLGQALQYARPERRGLAAKRRLHLWLVLGLPPTPVFLSPAQSREVERPAACCVLVQQLAAEQVYVLVLLEAPQERREVVEGLCGVVVAAQQQAEDGNRVAALRAPRGGVVESGHQLASLLAALACARKRANRSCPAPRFSTPERQRFGMACVSCPLRGPRWLQESL